MRSFLKRPWAEKTGLAKATAILSTVLVVALGLCGANFFAVICYVPMGGPRPRPGEPEPSHWLSIVLAVTGFLQLAAIGGSLVGLVVVGLTGVFRGWGPAVQRLFGRDEKEGKG